MEYEESMRAITVHRPWDKLILSHGKNIENRSWRPPDSLIGQRLAIHAGKKIDNAGIARLMGILRGDKLAYAHDAQTLCGEAGVIVGVVMVGGWVKAAYQGGLVAQSSNFGERVAYDYLNSNWFDGPYGWVLENPIALRNPIPCKGQQRLWNVPEILEAEIYEQLRG